MRRMAVAAILLCASACGGDSMTSPQWPEVTVERLSDGSPVWCVAYRPWLRSGRCGVRHVDVNSRFSTQSWRNIPSDSPD